MGTLQMTRAERETFLADVHVGVLSIDEEGRGPLTVPIWYDYEPGGELRLITDRDSRKGRLLRLGRHVSLCAQNETPPYRYVSVEGPVVGIGPADTDRDARPMAHRYLGAELGDRYIASTAADRERGRSMLVRIRPLRWLTVDYRKQFEG